MSCVEIKVLGAAGEVGRSAFQVNCDGTNFLLDYGVMFGKPRGGNYHWIDNHIVRATRFKSKMTEFVKKMVEVEVFDD